MWVPLFPYPITTIYKYFKWVITCFSSIFQINWNIISLVEIEKLQKLLIFCSVCTHKIIPFYYIVLSSNIMTDPFGRLSPTQKASFFIKKKDCVALTDCHLKEISVIFLLLWTFIYPDSFSYHASCFDFEHIPEII